MKFQELTEEEIFKLNPEQLQIKIEETKRIYKSLDNMPEIIIGDKINEIVAPYNIKTIEIELYYEDNGEGFNKINLIYINNNTVFYETNKIVPKFFEDVEDISFYNLHRKIDDELSKLEFLIQKDMVFNIPKLRSKYKHHKELRTKIEKTKEIYEILSRMTKTFIERKLSETIFDYDVKIIDIMPHCEM